MHFFKSLMVLAVVYFVSVTAGVGRRANDGPLKQYNIGVNKPAVEDNCNNYLGDCYSNGCSPVFDDPNHTTGTCTAGTYNGCPCEKCGGGVGYVGSCSDNGCDGYQGVCTAGNYQGCQCD